MRCRRLRATAIVEFAVAICVTSCLGCGHRSVSRVQASESRPTWYAVSKTHANVIDGFGQGETVAQASARALRDISGQISVRVDGATGLYQVAVNGRLVQDTVLDRTLVQTGELLRHAVRLRSEWRGDTVFVQHRVDVRSLAARMAEVLLHRWGGRRPRRIKWRGSLALTRGHFATQLANRLVSDTSRNVRVVTISLQRRSGAYCIVVDGVDLPLDNLKIGSLVAFTSRGTEGAATLNPVSAKSGEIRHRFIDGDQLHFQIECLRPGFLTLLNVYQDGRVSLVFGNQRPREVRRVPASGDFTTTILENGGASTDVYVLLVSDSKLDLGRFAGVREDAKLVQGEDKFQLAELLALMGRVEVVTAVATTIVTEPRYEHHHASRGVTAPSRSR